LTQYSRPLSSTQKIILGSIALVLLGFPLYWWLGWAAVCGYIFGVVAMTAYLLYLLLFA
jgi:hypothetical protein